MADDPIKKCASCADGVSFTDYPEGMAEARWPDRYLNDPDAPLMTMCNNCGASYPQSSVDASVRAPVPDHHDGDANATMRLMQLGRPGVKDAEIVALKAKLAELEGD